MMTMTMRIMMMVRHGSMMMMMTMVMMIDDDHDGAQLPQRSGGLKQLHFPTWFFCS